jgi:hypothetical protein
VSVVSASGAVEVVHLLSTCWAVFLNSLPRFKKEERGRIVDSGLQQSVPDPNAGTAARASAAATKHQTSYMNRGSEFKKTAQQVLNK